MISYNIYIHTYIWHIPIYDTNVCMCIYTNLYKVSTFWPSQQWYKGCNNFWVWVEGQLDSKQFESRTLAVQGVSRSIKKVFLYICRSLPPLQLWLGHLPIPHMHCFLCPITLTLHVLQGPNTHLYTHHLHA